MVEVILKVQPDLQVVVAELVLLELQVQMVMEEME